MSQGKQSPLSISVKDRLLNISKKRRDDFNFTLVQYAIERFLYRLSQSPHADQFILKGATLFAVWSGELHRPTRDLDFLGFGPSDNDSLRQLFSSICETSVPDDGLIFDARTIQVGDIREDQEYGGKRISFRGHLGTAAIPMKIDVGFGDVITPETNMSSYPALLPFPQPQLRTYPKETVVAEKLHAMAILGMANSRMKDFFDLWTISRLFQFEGQVLRQAIQATFDQRQTEITLVEPTGLTIGFAEDPQKIRQWQAFVNRSKLEVNNMGLSEIIIQLRVFLLPVWKSTLENKSFYFVWKDGQWRKIS